MSKWMRYLSHVLVILWMIFIFYMSAQPGDVSGDISGGISHLFMQIWNAVFGLGWNEVEILQMAEVWDYPIRKLAHMTEFGILAILVYWVLGYYQKFQSDGLLEKKRYAAACLVSVIYAATDEIHQLFVPDRSGNLFDVFVDTGGIIIALILVLGCKILRNRKR